MKPRETGSVDGRMTMGESVGSIGTSDVGNNTESSWGRDLQIRVVVVYCGNTEGNFLTVSMGAPPAK
jgi:hypothetical protein